MSVRLLLHHHCHHPLLLLTSTPGSKLIFSTNLFLRSSSTFPPTGLTPRTLGVFRFFSGMSVLTLSLCARLKMKGGDYTNRRFAVNFYLVLRLSNVAGGYCLRGMSNLTGNVQIPKWRRSVCIEFVCDFYASSVLYLSLIHISESTRPY